MIHPWITSYNKSDLCLAPEEKQSAEILLGQKHLCSISEAGLNALGLSPHVQLFGLLFNLSLLHCSLCSATTLGDTQRRLIEKQS